MPLLDVSRTMLWFFLFFSSTWLLVSLFDMLTNGEIQSEKTASLG